MAYHGVFISLVFFHKRYGLSVIIFRYLSKEILSTVLATILILLIIFITNQFVHYLNDAADGKITVQAVMEVMLLQVPLLLGYLLPLSLLLGILLTLGRFYVDHEMVVLSACGFSRTQLVTMVITLSVFVMGVVAWLILSVEPKMQLYRARILTEAVMKASIEKILPGRFQPLGSGGRVFYAADVSEHRQSMNQVFLAQNQAPANTPERWDLVSADQAKDFNIENEGNFILFNKGFRYVGTPGQLKYDVIQFKQYGIRLKTPVTDIASRIEAMPTNKLWLIRKSDPKAAAELQWRIAMPISVIIFALLAVPLSQVNPRKGRFAQILPAILIYIGYANLLFIGRTWIERKVVSQGVGMWWIHLSLLLVVLVFYMGQSSWRRRIRRFSRRRIRAAA